MVNNDFRAELPHSIQLEERHRLAVTGVSEVLSFDENEVIMDTSLGLLTVEGEGLHVEKLSLDMGELSLEGSIQSLCYSHDRQKKGSFWSRVF
jgi:sporulation protein YabP